MILFNTLDSIVDDIILQARNNNISESEHLSRYQVIQWIMQYRTFLIKQDIDKGRDVNQAYVQMISSVKLDPVDYSFKGWLTTDKVRYVTIIDIPRTIDFAFKSGLLNVTDMFGNEIQIIDKNRAELQKSRRYSNIEYVAYRIGNKIFVEGPGELEYINIFGIFEDPSKIQGGVSLNDPYPIPLNMIPLLKELIFAKELKWQMPIDNANNSVYDPKQIVNVKN